MSKKAKRKSKYKFPMDVVKLIRKVEKKILEEPKRFDMGIIAKHYDQEYVKQIEHDLPPCGTTACIAGWIGLIDLGDKIKWKDSSSYIKMTEQNLWNYARRKLKIPEASDMDYNDENNTPPVSAQSLFLETNWPQPFRRRFCEATTRRQEANIAVERLEHMLTTGE